MLRDDTADGDAMFDGATLARYYRDGSWDADTVAGWVRRNGAGNPDGWAFLAPDAELTWADYEELAVRLAGAFVRLGHDEQPQVLRRVGVRGGRVRTPHRRVDPAVLRVERGRAVECDPHRGPGGEAVRHGRQTDPGATCAAVRRPWRRRDAR